MSILRINGEKRLNGTLKVQGAKNSVLPIMAASILAEGETVIHNCPSLSDVDAAIKILTHLGCQVERRGTSLYINSSVLIRGDIPDSLMREMRSSVIFLGAILARIGEATLSLPGGCELGPRPIDMHLFALRSMGAKIIEENGNIHCSAKQLKGCRIDLVNPSVGATENSMLAATHCSGVTVITNAAREPEIWDLQEYLNKIGAQIKGAGSSIITVRGSNFSHYCEHSIIPDRIAAATFLSAVASAGGVLELSGVIPEHLQTVTQTLSEMGCKIKSGRDYIKIEVENRLKAVRPIITKPYPGFPTDAQPPIMAAAIKAEGTTAFVENIFINRYRHVDELLRMGAEIKVEGRVAIVSGVDKIHGAPLKATDLRGGASLIVAALGASGITDIGNLSHIDRGYDHIERSLTQLGADIIRLET